MFFVIPRIQPVNGDDTASCYSTADYAWQRHIEDLLDGWLSVFGASAIVQHFYRLSIPISCYADLRSCIGHSLTYHREIVIQLWTRPVCSWIPPAFKM